MGFCSSLTVSGSDRCASVLPFRIYLLLRSTFEREDRRPDGLLSPTGRRQSREEDEKQGGLGYRTGSASPRPSPGVCRYVLVILGHKSAHAPAPWSLPFCQRANDVTGRDPAFSLIVAARV